MPEEKKSSPLFAGVVVVLILALIFYGLYKYTMKDETNNTTDTPVVVENNNPTPEPTTPIPTTPQLNYKDGTYTSEGNYISPGGQEKISVSVTIKDDVITDATVKSLAVNPTSKMMQANFISGFKAMVVGKKLDEITLTKVSGSSLTPKGWNDAIAKIQVQAKA